MSPFFFGRNMKGEKAVNEMLEARGGVSLSRTGERDEAAKRRYRTELRGLIMMRTGLRTNREIAVATGYNPNTIWQIFSGRFFPSVALQHRFCQLLGIKLSELRKLL